MGRHTELVEHTICGTASVPLDGQVRRTVEDVLEKYPELMELHIVQGQDITVKCWEDVWTSGM